MHVQNIFMLSVDSKIPRLSKNIQEILLLLFLLTQIRMFKLWRNSIDIFYKFDLIIFWIACPPSNYLLIVIIEHLSFPHSWLSVWWSKLHASGSWVQVQQNVNSCLGYYLHFLGIMNIYYWNVTKIQFMEDFIEYL